MTPLQSCPTKMSNNCDRLDVKNNFLPIQKDNCKYTPMFCTFTKINGRRCKVILDGTLESTVSSMEIKNLNLIVFDHPLPYQWIDNIIYEVKQKCLVLIDFNAYKAHIWHDVITIEAGHILGYTMVI